MRRLSTPFISFSLLLSAGITGFAGSAGNAGTAHAQPFQRTFTAPLNERPNGIEHATGGGYIIAGTEKDITDV